MLVLTVNLVRKLPDYQNGAGSNQLTDVWKGGGGYVLGWRAINLLMCDRESAPFSINATV
jgi:hypothetical protein